MTSETFCISVVLLDIYIQSCSALLLNLNTASSSPPGSRAVLHGHVAAEDPPGGAGPGAHASWEGSHRRRPQPQLWPAAGVRPGRQAAPGQLWSRRYVWGVCGSHVINLKKKRKTIRRLLPPRLLRWTEPPSLPAGLEHGRRLGGRRVRRAHHAAPQQLAAQQDVLPQQGGRARPEAAARLHQCKSHHCFVLHWT